MTTPRLDPAKLDAVKTLIVHDNCADGTASAILLQDAFHGRDVKIRFIQYGTADFQALTPEPGMLFCDFSPPAERAQEFVDAGAIVLDHHKTAKPVVDAFGDNGVFGDELTAPGICGASLAFTHVWLPLCGDMVMHRTFAERFATLAGIRDTWQRQDPAWKDACVQANVLHFLPAERWLSRTLMEIAINWDRDFKPIGELLWDKREKSTQRVCKEALRFQTQKGTRVVVFSGLGETSDAAEAIGSEADLIVGFLPVCEGGALKYLFSTRSHTTFDCSALAKANGGGGHTKAAGFNVNIDMDSTTNPFKFVRALVEQYEGQF